MTNPQTRLQAIELSRRELQSILERDARFPGLWAALRSIPAELTPLAGEAVRDRRVLLRHIAALEQTLQGFAELTNELLETLDAEGYAAPAGVERIRSPPGSPAPELLVFDCIPHRPILQIPRPITLPPARPAQYELIIPTEDELLEGPTVESGELRPCAACNHSAVVCPICLRCPGCCAC